MKLCDFEVGIDQLQFLAAGAVLSVLFELDQAVKSRGFVESQL